MRRSALLVPVLLLCVACGEPDRPGNPAVYDRIDGLSSCTDLQAEFDIASASHDRAQAGSDDAAAAVGYMEAADSRLQDLDCY